MIDEIRVENLALIRSAVLRPASGMTVLTGETGAGKTALLSAIKLLVGERADKQQVRDGSDACVVEGRLFSEAGLEDDDELVVSRRVGSDGRGRATVNGSMVSSKELTALLAPEVDICSQHEHQRLLKSATHVELLDAWAGDKVADARREYADAFRAAREAADELDRVMSAGEASSVKLEEARFTLRQIDAVRPLPGEYEELSSVLERAENAEALANGANAAYNALSGDGGALDALAAAACALESAGAYDGQLKQLAASLREASYVLEDVSREACDYRDSVDFDADQLAYSQERVAALQSLMRTYGPRMEDVLAKREEAADLVSLVDDAEYREEIARKALDAAEDALAEKAALLHEARVTVAPQFIEAVNTQLARLQMSGAQVECAAQLREREQWTLSGPSVIEFLFCPGAGMQARPLARIASGGEVSRVMLAVKVALGSADSRATLVFDEVDAGVGGSAAVALAEVLADLAKTHQVIVVSHLAQVAVRAQSHYLVSKTMDDQGMPETTLREICEEERVLEVARMLSGDASDASVAHARELLG